MFSSICWPFLQELLVPFTQMLVVIGEVLIAGDDLLVLALASFLHVLP